jgi:hypothetical protein
MKAVRPYRRSLLVRAFAAAALALTPLATSAQSMGVSDVTGRILYAGAAVPGATVTATRGDKTFATTSDADGAFRLATLDDGIWTLHVEMRGFVTLSRDITVPPAKSPVVVTLTMQSLEDVLRSMGSPAVVPAGDAPAMGVASTDTPPLDAADIINGSMNNGAASPFAQSPAFGNGRPRGQGLYTGGVSAVLGNSAWNATPFSFVSGGPPAPSYGDVQVAATLGGPLKIPWLVTNGPNTVVAYQHNVSHNVTTQVAEMPTMAERAGDFSALGVEVQDPLTGLPFPGNAIPGNRISPQAAALLNEYPLPNVSATGANYEVPVVSAATQDSLQVSMTQAVHSRNTLTGTFAFQRVLTDTNNLFNFEDANRQSSLNGTVTWTRRLTQRSQLRFNYQYVRSATNETPFFANRQNVAGEARIAGNDQDPVNWGPPTLVFPDVAGLTDAEYQENTTQKHAFGAEASLKHGLHNLTWGGDVRRNDVEVESQPNPRGTLTFTGAATGVAFADFLLGLPTTSAIAFGNTDTRLRDITTDLYVNDAWQLRPGLTISVGVRWEYEAPFTEASGDLVNLDVAPGFTAITPVLATNPVGSLTGTSYPTSLIRPDKRGGEPRLATSWRPWLGSSLVIRASYGLYRNLGVYQSLALLLAQQPPLAKTFSVENSPQTPLTLANPFPSSLPTTTTNTFAVDSNFRDGDVQTWLVSAQRDLPASLTFTVAYLGAKGSHLMQAFLPNTYPAGAENPCPACPSGFVDVTSNGTSLRNAGQFTLRRRLANGFTASVQYTLSKATDDAASFSNTGITPTSLAIAQNWLDLDAERGPSPFDQRHLVTAQVQYSTGQGLAGGTLLDAFWGSLFKDWTIAGQLTAGSGLPLTPVSFVAVAGTGVVGVRPDLTGVAPEPAPAGYYVNPAAYTAPAPGTWGTASRDSIRGPAQFSLDMSLSRVFRLGNRLNLDWRIAATNVLNRVTFATIGTVVTSPQFGLPTQANPMRTLLMTVRLRF